MRSSLSGNATSLDQSSNLAWMGYQDVHGDRMAEPTPAKKKAAKAKEMKMVARHAEAFKVIGCVRAVGARTAETVTAPMLGKQDLNCPSNVREEHGKPDKPSKSRSRES